MFQNKYIVPIHIGIAILYVALFSVLAFRYVPQPFSDFLYFWQVSGHFDLYHKGGVLLLLYLPLKKMGLAPYTSAFVVNTLCWILLSFSLWFHPENRAERKVQILGSTALLLFGMWWAGMTPIVNSDLPHAAFLSFGLSRLFRSVVGASASRNLFPSIIFLSIGLSMRIQGMLAFSILLLLLLTIYIIKRFKTPFSSYKKIVLVLVVSIAISFSVEMFFRTLNPDVRTKKLFTRSTLYTGLLATNVDKNWCGSWTYDAIHLASKELDLPLSEVIYRYLKTSHSEITELITCKIIRYLSFDHFSFYWLNASLENQSGSPFTGNLSSRSDDLFRLLRIESIAAKGIKLLLLLLFVAGRISTVWRVRPDLWVLACLLFLAYLFEHAFLEIQPRYILGPITFSLITLLYGIKITVSPKPDSQN